MRYLRSQAFPNLHVEALKKTIRQGAPAGCYNTNGIPKYPKYPIVIMDVGV